MDGGVHTPPRDVVDSTGRWSLLRGDCRRRLAELPSASHQVCVTSPPYWGLRDYGTGRWEGGDPTCDHRRTSARSVAGSTLDGATTTQGHAQDVWTRGACGRCGARRVDDHQIGQEDSVTAYVAELVGVLREVRRILRPDGTLWLNLGDVRGRNPGAQGATGQRASRPSGAAQAAVADRRRATAPKSLVGLPWRVAFALVDDGWILRADIIWVKPRPMPESVTDRPTSSHEYVFLLARSRRYYYDAKAIATAAVKSASRNKRRRYGDDRSRPGDHLGASVPWEGDTANARDVWVIDHDDAVDRVPGHHALMPVELARRCVLAGSRPGDLVLDPFSGMASTGLAAVGAGRPYTGIELNPAYLATSAERLRSLDPTAPLRPSATAHWSLFERT